ncbi:putative methyltransferase-domain-containing protein [Pelagophyceae sp. CCMP2097]|nr:putative methyltransferase-domain-containing protein [Pelagophyceae sp. CCMP2097]|mmetsp:Transcript_28328/g.95373  ORF Transcript_28328/g.95373 Transcript_28328/m.95373 type:complete len:392 (+) Transcript_28328:155-1330(+)
MAPSSPATLDLLRRVAGGIELPAFAAAPEEAEQVAEWRARGNGLFKEKDFTAAFHSYSQGISRCGAGGDRGALLANRAQCALALGWSSRAAVDAALALLEDGNGDWRKKSWFRLGKALAARGEDALRLEAALCAVRERCAVAAEVEAAQATIADAAAQGHKRCADEIVRVALGAVEGEDEDASDDDDDGAVDANVLSIRVATLTQSSGGTVWDAAILLAHWLAERPQLVSNRGVLEVGAGCGVVGLACARLGARYVALTDFEPKIVDCLRESSARDDCCDAFVLDFRSPKALFADFDMIVGSECVYYESCSILADFAAKQTAHRPKSADPVAAFAMADSRAGLESFAAAAAAAGLRHDRRPFPKHLVRRARKLNRNNEFGNAYSLHLLYRD